MASSPTPQNMEIKEDKSRILFMQIPVEAAKPPPPAQTPNQPKASPLTIRRMESRPKPHNMQIKEDNSKQTQLVTSCKTAQKMETKEEDIRQMPLATSQYTAQKLETKEDKSKRA
jgi:hypothetical protein